MNLNRRFTNKINWIFDNLIPPFLRDSKIFMTLFFWMTSGEKRKYFMEFKNRIPFLNEREYKEYYLFLADKHLQRETDLNDESIQKILENIVGDTVLDAGCGKGFLSKKIADEMNINVFGIDINISDERGKIENPKFVEGSIESLPFESKTFDTVICAHTLEHIPEIQKAVFELRRVCKKRLMIIVPRQREYKYTFDLHVNFFPYIFNLYKVMKNNKAKCLIIKNDIFYLEDII